MSNIFGYFLMCLSHRFGSQIFSSQSIIAWIVFLQNAFVEALIHSGTMFGDKAFQEIINVKWSHKGEAVSNHTGGLVRRGRDTRATHAQRKSHMNTQKEASILISQGERPLEKPTLLASWSWTSSLQNFEKINFCCVCHTICGISWGQA